ncbi:MAG TPA: glycosyltransferase family 4 protein [Candidatus Bathyarchaeia archaeon]|nr:glycosyltransferase family 4 protein [Candidatus Bathyarchaeia archaeon]
MNQPSSLALISAGYPPYMWGGVDVQTYDLAHYLSAMGIKVTVFCGGATKPTVIREADNLTLYRLPILNVPPRVLWFQLQNARRIIRKLSEFDVVHSQHSSGSIYGLVKDKVGKPWVVSFHDHHFRRLVTYLSLKPWKFSLEDSFYYTIGYPVFDFLTRLEKLADHYIACGGAGLADFLSFSKISPGKVTLIRNGVDLDRIHSIASEESDENNNSHSSDSEFTIFNCGRLYATKGVEYLIRAMPLVLATNEKVKLKIFGKGPMEETLRTMIKSMRLEKNVTLEGHVPYRRLIKEMNRSTLAVFPTMVEVGASLAIMETMACHKAVVAFDYPFTREVIEHKRTGYLVPSKNVPKLANAISLLLEDGNLRKEIGENAFSNIHRNHDYRTVVQKYVEVYSRLITEGCTKS